MQYHPLIQIAYYMCYSNGLFKHVVDPLIVLIHQSMWVSPVGDCARIRDFFFYVYFFAVMWWRYVEHGSTAVFIPVVNVAAAVLCQLFSFQRWFHIMETDVQPVTGNLICKKKKYISHINDFFTEASIYELCVVLYNA